MLSSNAILAATHICSCAVAMKTKFATFVAIAAATASYSSFAAPVFLGASITLDKPAYNATYSLGVSAYTTSLLPLQSVTANHQAVSSDSFGAWALADYGPSSWWNWAPMRAQQSSGPLDGAVTVRATDEAGDTAEMSMAFQPSEELDTPFATYAWNGSGFDVVGQSVLNADVYNLWVWDPIDRYYAFSLSSTKAEDLSIIPGEVLKPERVYSAYYMANNYVSEKSDVPYSINYRSYSLKFLVAPAAQIPEPTTLALVGAAVLGMATTRRRRPADRIEATTAAVKPIG